MKDLADVSSFKRGEWTRSIPGNCLVDRDEWIIAQCVGKTVLHIGAADAPFDLEKGRAGELLHQKVQQVASRVLGIDVNQAAIDALASIGVNDIFYGDICQEGLLRGETFDVILCCDVIEHVPAPGPLLEGCRSCMRSDSLLVVTTINATGLKPAIRALSGRESVHDDHLAYFSFATLGTLLMTYSLNPVQFGVFAYPTVSRLVGWLTRRVMSAAPGTADGIIMTASFKEIEKD